MSAAEEEANISSYSRTVRIIFTSTNILEKFNSRHTKKRARQFSHSLTFIEYVHSYFRIFFHNLDKPELLPRLYCWKRGCVASWTGVPLASKSRQRWNRWANNDGPVGLVRRRSRMTIRSIGRTLCHPRIPWAMSRTGPPTRSYPPLCRVARVEFGTVRCRSPYATKTRGFSGTNRLSIIGR